MFKFVTKLIYYMSLIFGFSCFYFDSATNQMKYSKALYIFNRLCFLLTIILPYGNMLGFMSQYNNLSIPMKCLLLVQSAMQTWKISKIYKQLGMMKKSLMKTVNEGISLYNDLKKVFDLKFSLNIFNLIVFKVLVIDFFLLFIRFFVTKKLIEQFEVPLLVVFTSCMVSTLSTFLLNFYYIFHAAISCILHEFDKELTELLETCERASKIDEKMLFKLLQLQELYLRLRNFRNDFKSLFENLISTVFVHSQLSFLVELVCIFAFFQLYLFIEEKNFYYFFVSICVAFVEFCHLLAMTLTVDQMEQMVRRIFA